MAYVAEVVFVETPIFYRRVQQLMDDDDYAEMQLFLAGRPDAGAVIKGSGGMRKLRWAGSGRGKRGGLRVILLLVSGSRQDFDAAGVSEKSDG